MIAASVFSHRLPSLRHLRTHAPSRRWSRSALHAHVQRPETIALPQSIMPKHAQPGAPAIGDAGTRVQAANASTKRPMLFLGHLVALCTARTRPAPRNNRASTINHAKTRTAWSTGNWGCGHACTGRERGHQASHAPSAFLAKLCKLYQRKQKINRQIHENGEETGRVNPFSRRNSGDTV